jgi:hypothetical protein
MPGPCVPVEVLGHHAELDVARQILGLSGPDSWTFRSSQGRSASPIACAPHASQVAMLAPCRELQTGIAGPAPTQTVAPT